MKSENIIKLLVILILILCCSYLFTLGSYMKYIILQENKMQELETKSMIQELEIRDK